MFFTGGVYLRIPSILHLSFTLVFWEDHHWFTFSFVLSFYFRFGQKSAVLPVFLMALILPTELLALTSFNEVTQLTLGFLLTYFLIGVYLFCLVKMEKKKTLIKD